MPHAVAGPPGAAADQRPQAPGAAGDQHRPVRDPAAGSTVSTTLPVWRAWAMKRNACRGLAHVRTPSPATAAAPPPRTAPSARPASPRSGPDPPRAGRTTGRPPRGCSRPPARGSRMSVLPISTNRPPRRQQPQRRIDELPRQRVQHHIHPAAVGPARNALELQGPRRRDPLARPPPAPRTACHLAGLAVAIHLARPDAGPAAPRPSRHHPPPHAPARDSPARSPARSARP